MMRSIVPALLCLLVTAAVAALDPDPDSLGIYFDDQGNYNCLGNGLPMFVPTDVHIVLMNPTTAVWGFELGYRIEGWPAHIFRTANTVHGIDPADVGDSSDPAAGSYVCGYADARPPVPAMVLVTWTIFSSTDDPGLWFYLGPAPTPSLPGGLPVIDGGPGLGRRRVGVASGRPAVHVAATMMCPVGEERTSFGSVKSLFR